MHFQHLNILFICVVGFKKIQFKSSELGKMQNLLAYFALTLLTNQNAKIGKVDPYKEILSQIWAESMACLISAGNVNFLRVRPPEAKTEKKSNTAVKREDNYINEVK